MLTASARHNPTLDCSPLADDDHAEHCPHSFREHVLFCCSPEKPGLVVSFKWEEVQLWRLQPPHLPLWDATSGLFLEDAKVSSATLRLGDWKKHLLIPLLGCSRKLVNG